MCLEETIGQNGQAAPFFAPLALECQDFPLNIPLLNLPQVELPISWAQECRLAFGATFRGLLFGQISRAGNAASREQTGTTRG